MNEDLVLSHLAQGALILALAALGLIVVRSGLGISSLLTTRQETV
jgi:hypothetical protein